MAVYRVPAVSIVLVVALTACSDVDDSQGGAAPTTAGSDRIDEPSRPGMGPASPPTTAAKPRPRRPTVMRLTIPTIRIRDLRVIAYTGTPDDRPGTRIQNRGVAATPRGPGGGVGPGEVGNFIITAHRTTHGRPFGQLPRLRNGAIISVTAAGKVYDYRVSGTMTISFRSARSKALQTAPVPGHPGVRPIRPIITLSTCATPEDIAQGNYWKDSLGNLEHRIDKVGTLVATRRA